MIMLHVYHICTILSDRCATDEVQELADTASLLEDSHVAAALRCARVPLRLRFDIVDRYSSARGAGGWGSSARAVSRQIPYTTHDSREYSLYPTHSLVRERRTTAWRVHLCRPEMRFHMPLLSPFLRKMAVHEEWDCFLCG